MTLQRLKDGTIAPWPVERTASFTQMLASGMRSCDVGRALGLNKNQVAGMRYRIGKEALVAARQAQRKPASLAARRLAEFDPVVRRAIYG